MYEMLTLAFGSSILLGVGAAFGWFAILGLVDGTQDGWVVWWEPFAVTLVWGVASSVFILGATGAIKAIQIGLAL